MADAIHTLGKRMHALESRIAASIESNSEQFLCLRNEVRVLTEMVRKYQRPPADRQYQSETLDVVPPPPQGGSKSNDEARYSSPHQPNVGPQRVTNLPSKNSYLTASGTIARDATGDTDDEHPDADESLLDEMEDVLKNEEINKEAAEKKEEDDKGIEAEELRIASVRPDQIICAKIDRRQQYLRAYQPDDGGNVSETSDEDSSYYDNILDQLPDRSNKTVRTPLPSDDDSNYESAAESVEVPGKMKEANSRLKSIASKSCKTRSPNSNAQDSNHELSAAPLLPCLPADRTAVPLIKVAHKPSQSHVKAMDANNKSTYSHQQYDNSVTAMFKAGIKPPVQQLVPIGQQPNSPIVRHPPAPQPTPRVHDEDVEEQKTPALSALASSTNTVLRTTIDEYERVLFDEQVELWQCIAEGDTPYRGAGRMKLIKNLDLSTTYGVMHRASKRKPKVAEFVVKKGIELVKYQNECVLTWRCLDTSKDRGYEAVEFLCKFENKAHLSKFEKVIKEVVA
ncbi:hypothetical protein M3Y99_01922300 [Aphelenchoides fujianensis]|nr:hypothetical protein M3Y99_01922300 [Aphelenchoides fujianensis]